jgi:hypothetical protein
MAIAPVDDTDEPDDNFTFPLANSLAAAVTSCAPDDPMIEAEPPDPLDDVAIPDTISTEPPSTPDPA